MAQHYRVTRRVRAVNAIVSALARRGKGPASELTVVGRVSGEPRTVRVTPIEVDGSWYLVAPYVAVGRVSNLRATGRGTISRDGARREFTVDECNAEEAGPVLEAYYHQLVKIVGPYFDVPESPSTEDFVAVAADHPVFRYADSQRPKSERSTLGRIPPAMCLALTGSRSLWPIGDARPGVPGEQDRMPTGFDVGRDETCPDPPIRLEHELRDGGGPRA